MLSFRLDQKALQRSLIVGLQAMGLYEQIVTDSEGNRFRVDANETATFARELEHVFTDVVRKEYPDLMGRVLIPSKPGVPSGAETHTYTEIERFGQAKIINDMATDFPSTEVQGNQVSEIIRSYGDSYQWSVQDLRRQALTKVQFVTEKAEAAREAMENLADQLMLFGDVQTGLKGLNSPTLVANYNAITKGTQVTGTTWPTATPSEILADVRELFKSVSTVTKNKHKANTLVLDVASYNHILYTERGGTSQSDTQMLYQYLLANVPGLQSIECWSKLDHAGAANKSRTYAYERNPNVLYQVEPQPFEQFAPERRNLAFVVPCHARWGGVVVRFPKAVAYMDGTGYAS